MVVAEADDGPSRLILRRWYPGCRGGESRGHPCVRRARPLVVDVAAGHPPCDPFSLRAPIGSYLTALDTPLPDLRVGVLATQGVATPRPEILAALERAAARAGGGCSRPVSARSVWHPCSPRSH
ncbi:hypothetical protein AB0M42_15430, partial [Streptomyces sp. NPDC051784]|uniref:hypothetical protein n=1 Tax=Streptomyces sp. NPDC051784 TaxID=3155805 RepID=UPI003442344A